uniref:Uncharacterized protein n=1 Tax=viral metagenome TaxID=1070528 RepID=A0A6C0CYV1_9ZZZZ
MDKYNGCYMDEYDPNDTNDCRTMKVWKDIYKWVNSICNVLSVVSGINLVILIIIFIKFFSEMDTWTIVILVFLLITQLYFFVIVYTLSRIADKKTEQPRYDHVNKKQWYYFMIPNLENIVAVIIITIIVFFILLISLRYFYNNLWSMRGSLSGEVYTNILSE